MPNVVEPRRALASASSHRSKSDFFVSYESADSRCGGRSNGIVDGLAPALGADRPGTRAEVADDWQLQSPARLLEANERRLNALNRRGVRIVVGGVDVLEFVLDQYCAGAPDREIQHRWALDIAHLLERIETETSHPEILPQIISPRVA